MSDEDDFDNYTPIACATYSEYEVAILHRQPIRLHWRDANGIDHLDRVIPHDLQTRNHCEFLLATNSEGTSVAIRLDRILLQDTDTA